MGFEFKSRVQNFLLDFANCLNELVIYPALPQDLHVYRAQIGVEAYLEVETVLFYCVYISKEYYKYMYVTP
jgi:hypothetical protein